MGKCCSKGKVLPGDGSTDSAKGVMQRPEMKRMAPEDRPVFKTGITDDYTFFLNEPLGRGSFGIVFKAKGKDDDKTYAVKCVQKSAMTDDDREDLFREVKIMGLLGNSLNIVYLYDAYEDEQNYYLVMEYCSGGQLFSRVKRFNRRYNEARVASLMRSILQVCAQCHSKNIIYRDVKPENFLFLNDDPDSPIKATDFGLAVHKPPGTPALKLRAGTPAYMAPEVVNRDYGKEADIWSCGVIAYQLLTGRFPFRGTAIPTYASRKVDPNSTLGHMQSMYADIRANDADFSGDAWKTISRQGKDFVKKLLHKDPRKRLTAADALNHPWMAVAEEQEDESGYVSGGSQSGRNDNELGDTVVQRLQLFSSYGHIKQALLNDISQRLPGPAHEAKTRQLEAAQRLFHEMDEAKTGSLSQEDLQKGLWNAGFKLAESEVQQIIAAIDLTGTGEISLDEFEAALVDWRGIVDEVGEEEWQAAAVNHFREMDTAGSGYVTVNSIALPEGGDKAAKKGTGTHSRASRSNSTNSPSVAAAVLREKDFLALVEPKEDLKHFDKRLAGRSSTPGEVGGGGGEGGGGNSSGGGGGGRGGGESTTSTPKHTPAKSGTRASAPA